MNRVFRSLSLFAVLAVYVMNCAEAQTKFSIHIGGSLPFGKYADYSLSPSSTPDGSDIIDIFGYRDVEINVWSEGNNSCNGKYTILY